MRPFAFALALLVTGASLVGAQGQQKPSTSGLPGGIPVAPGMRVRVSATILVAPFVGSYLEARGDTLIFVEDGSGRAVWSLTPEQITKLEVTIGEQTGHKHDVLLGAAIGGGIGAISFGFYAANYHPSDKTRDYNTLGTGFIGAVVGGGIGAFIGSRRKGEKWRPIYQPKKISFAPDLHGGWRLGGTLSF